MCIMTTSCSQVRVLSSIVTIIIGNKNGSLCCTHFIHACSLTKTKSDITKSA